MWSELIARLKTPVRGTESHAEYLNLPKSKQDELKDVGGFVAGTLQGDRRKASAVIERDVITLDLDNNPAGSTRDILQRIEALGCGYAVYSMISAKSPLMRVSLKKPNLLRSRNGWK
jgi:hypothetical protein